MALMTWCDGVFIWKENEMYDRRWWLRQSYGNSHWFFTLMQIRNNVKTSFTYFIAVNCFHALHDSALSMCGNDERTSGTFMLCANQRAELLHRRTRLLRQWHQCGKNEHGKIVWICTSFFAVRFVSYPAWISCSFIYALWTIFTSAVLNSLSANSWVSTSVFDLGFKAFFDSICSTLSLNFLET